MQPEYYLLHDTSDQRYTIIDFANALWINVDPHDPSSTNWFSTAQEAFKAANTFGIGESDFDEEEDDDVPSTVFMENNATVQDYCSALQAYWGDKFRIIPYPLASLNPKDYPELLV